MPREEHKLERLAFKQRRLDLEERISRRADWMSLTKWLITGVAAVAGFFLVDLARERRAADLQEREFQQSLFEGYMDPRDEDNLTLWERKLRKLSAFIEPEAKKLREFVGAEQTLIDELKRQEQVKATAEAEEKRLGEELSRLEKELAETASAESETIRRLGEDKEKLQKQITVEAKKARTALEELYAAGVTIKTFAMVRETLEQQAHDELADQYVYVICDNFGALLELLEMDLSKEFLKNIVDPKLLGVPQARLGNIIRQHITDLMITIHMGERVFGESPNFTELRRIRELMMGDVVEPLMEVSEGKDVRTQILSVASSIRDIRTRLNAMKAYVKLSSLHSLSHAR